MASDKELRAEVRMDRQTKVEEGEPRGKERTRGAQCGKKISGDTVTCTYFSAFYGT